MVLVDLIFLSSNKRRVEMIKRRIMLNNKMLDMVSDFPCCFIRNQAQKYFNQPGFSYWSRLPF